MKPVANPSEWIDAYLGEKQASLRDLGHALREFVGKHAKGSTESVNPWRIPTFESNGPMCIMMVGNNHVTFGFLRGASLPDPKQLLQGTGKNLRHIKLRTTADLQNPALKSLLAAAVKLNKKEPMESMKAKKKAK